MSFYLYSFTKHYFEAFIEILQKLEKFKIQKFWNVVLQLKFEINRYFLFR